MPWPERTEGTPRALALVLVISSTLGGCATVRDFLIPPQSHAQVRTATTATPTLVLESVTLPGASTATALVLSEGKIRAVGPAGGGTEASMMRIGRRGLRAEPSWTDSHIHLSGAALLQDATVLSGAAATDPDAFAQAIAHRVGAMRPGGWVWCLGAQPALLAALTPEGLARRVGSAAVWISAADGHGAMLSPAAVQLLPKALADQAQQRAGRLDGAIARNAWRSMPLLPGRTMALMVTLLRRFAAAGIAEVHSMGESVVVMRMLEQLAKQRRLPIRVRVYLDADDPGLDDMLKRSLAAEASGVGRGLGSDPRSRLQLAGLKVWLDGSLGARTAQLRSSYADGTGSGVAEASGASLAAALERCDRAGLQLAVHAVGEAALDRLLRVLEGATRPVGALPVRVEHAQVVAPDQLPRLRGLLCSVQPLHRVDDAAFAGARLGPDRSSWGYRAASLAPTCALLAGSDLPIGRFDVQDIVRELQGIGALGRAENERLGQNEAIATLLRQATDGRVRSLAVGEAADIRLLDGDKLVALIVGGEIAWRSGERL